MSVSAVGKWMEFIGWSNGGSPGSEKRDAGGKTIAKHGDPVWIEDVQDCCDRAQAEAARMELERRGVFSSSQQHTEAKS